MKTLGKVLLWGIGLLGLLIAYYAVEDRTRGWVIIIGCVTYAWWSLQKQISDIDARTDARLERIEQMLHNLRDEGLSEYEREGLQALAMEMRLKRSPVDQP